jgi:hypothetical protein
MTSWKKKLLNAETENIILTSFAYFNKKNL